MSAADFFCGGHVVCLDARWSPFFGEASPLEQGRIYVVTAIAWESGLAPDLTLFEGVVLALDGCPHPAGAFGFFANRFRPLDEQRLAWARRIAAHPPSRVDEVA